MNVRCIFLVVIYIFVISVESRHRKNSNENLNMVLFFAESDNMPVSDLGVQILELQKIAQVKHNANPGTTHAALNKRYADECKDNLKENLNSLINFCKNVLGMNTALLKMSSHSITQDIREKNAEKVSKWKTNHKRKNNLKNVPSVSEITTPKEIIRSPQHTEVFKIRVKRNATNDEHNDENKNNVEQFIGEPVDNTKMQHPWDVLDVWSHVRFSFFGNMFKDKKKDRLSKQENDVLTQGVISKAKDSGLFETVQNSLNSLQEAPEAFLMVVFGGQLQEVSEKYSLLVQTIKHVIENTDPENTLLILTGNCPEIKRINNGVVEINENVKQSLNLNKIPIYGKGPNCGKLNECIFLFDIPLIIKKSLQEVSSIFDGNH